MEKKIRSALPLYIAAGAFLVCAAVLPVYSLPGFLGACAVAAGAYFLSDKKIPPRVVMVPAPESSASGNMVRMENLLGSLEKRVADIKKNWKSTKEIWRNLKGSLIKNFPMNRS